MDWQHYLKVLRKAGWSDRRIAEAVDCSTVYIWQLRTGKRNEPGHALGERLRQLNGQRAP